MYAAENFTTQLFWSERRHEINRHANQYINIICTSDSIKSVCVTHSSQDGYLNTICKSALQLRIRGELKKNTEILNKSNLTRKITYSHLTIFRSTV